MFEFLDVIQSICAECIDMTSIGILEKLALLERDFPLSLQVIEFHLMHHLPKFLERFGPVNMFWMYPYERFNSWIIRRVMNRRFPESTVVETYRLTEWASFMELSGELSKGTITGAITDSDCPVVSESKHFVLPEDIMESLQSHYESVMPQLKELSSEKVL